MFTWIDHSVGVFLLGILAGMIFSRLLPGAK
jgi:hypothetical protein